MVILHFCILVLYLIFILDPPKLKYLEKAHVTYFSKVQKSVLSVLSERASASGVLGTTIKSSLAAWLTSRSIFYTLKAVCRVIPLYAM